MTPETTYPKMSAALNATGYPIVFNMCEWGVDDPWKWGPAVAQTWRMAGDHTGVWSSTKSTIAASAAIPAAYSGAPYAWNDMDMLETGCGFGPGMNPLCAHANGRQSNMTRIEFITEFSMWAISASPLIFTSPVMNCSANASAPTGVTCVPWISDVQREILFNDEVIAINQDVTPQGRPVADGDLTVWARKLSDGSAAVALYNQEDTPAVLSVAFASLGWPSGTSAAVRDLWAHADLGSFTDRYPASGGVTVPPHGTHVVRITPSKRVVGGGASAVA
jgi:alpha-galactosidase